MISPRLWIEELRARAQTTSGDIDPESVHQVRVAAGRLSVWLELCGRRMLRDDLSWLRRSASRARDLDVVAETIERSLARVTASRRTLRDGDGPLHADPWAEWRAHLGRERASASSTLRQALASARLRGLVIALSRLPALDPERARRALRGFRRRVERAESKLERAPRDLAVLHRLRRAVRRLRYALEWLGQDAQTWKALQDELGELNDLAVCLRRLDADEPAAADGTPADRRASAQSEIESRIDERRARIVHHWSRMRAPADEG
jgi:CHAD domain-containing protein